MKTLCKLLAILIITQLGTAGIAYSTNYYVSLSGDDIQGDGTINNPWRHPEYGAKQLQAGDTLFIHAGTYIISPSHSPESSPERHKPMVSPWPGSQGTASAPITITSYQNDQVFLDGGTSPPYPVIGAGGGGGKNAAYIVIDGLTIRGAASFMWTDNCILQNSDIYGGIDCPQSNGGDNFGCVVRVEGGDGNIIRNNKLHNNQIGITQENSPLLIEYDSSNLLIENNEIYNGVSAGIRLKDNPENITVRYNYIHDNTHSGLSGANQDQGHDVKIYQNIFRNNNTSNNSEHGAIMIQIYIMGWKIYNNTFIDNNWADIRAVWATGIGDIQVWNNIFFNSNRHYHLGWSSAGNTFSGEWTYADFNNFSNGGTWQEWSNSWTSVSDFQTNNDKNFDTNSTTINPSFVNYGGTSPEDYKRTSYPTVGRGGSFASVIGAYITGNEIIGTTSQTLPSRPSPPAEFQQFSQ